MPAFLTKTLLCLLLVSTVAFGQRVDDAVRKRLAEKTDTAPAEPVRRFGLVVETYSYSHLMYNKFGIGGYFAAVTYRPIPYLSVGIGYDYSVYNHAILLDVRQEVTQMRVKPLLLVGLGYSVAGRKQTVTSSFGVGQELAAKPDLVYRVGGGLRGYFLEKKRLGISAGLFYKNEPGFKVSETKTGSILVESFGNIGSVCVFLGFSL